MYNNINPEQINSNGYAKHAFWHLAENGVRHVSKNIMMFKYKHFWTFIRHV
jgi:hypothetical protein